MIHIMDKGLAAQIVDAIRQVVNKDINFIDKKGVIIASTNKERVGRFHKAGHEVALTREMIIVSEENRLEGTKKGINYPIIIGGEVIGVIGITGEPEETIKYGFLATKITEILVREEEIKDSYESRKKLIQYLMNMCIYEKEIENTQLKEVLEKLHLKEKESYFCTIIEIAKDNIDFIRVEERIVDLLMQYNLDLYLYKYPNRFVVFCPKNKMKIFYNSINELGNKGIEKTYTGIGDSRAIAEVRYSYELALTALKYAKQVNKPLVKSNELDIELILEELSKDTKEKYISKIIGNLSEAEVKLLNVYYECNMSLKETAEKLFIHKNTVQYRLEKISQLVGLNPRDFKETVKIYLAIYLREI